MYEIILPGGAHRQVYRRNQDKSSGGIDRFLISEVR